MLTERPMPTRGFETAGGIEPNYCAQAVACGWALNDARATAIGVFS